MDIFRGKGRAYEVVFIRPKGEGLDYEEELGLDVGYGGNDLVELWVTIYCVSPLRVLANQKDRHQ